MDGDHGPGSRDVGNLVLLREVREVWLHEGERGILRSPTPDHLGKGCTCVHVGVCACTGVCVYICA